MPGRKKTLARHVPELALGASSLKDRVSLAQRGVAGADEGVTRQLRNVGDGGFALADAGGLRVADAPCVIALFRSRGSSCSGLCRRPTRRHPSSTLSSQAFPLAIGDDMTAAQTVVAAAHCSNVPLAPAR